MRIEALDILTHAHFGGAVTEGADHGRGLLFEVYRYLDARIGALHAHLDADDVLVVFSDHGIATAWPDTGIAPWSDRLAERSD